MASKMAGWKSKNQQISKWYIKSYVFRVEKHDYDNISMIKGHFQPLNFFWIMAYM